jgi:hypothetical protein
MGPSREPVGEASEADEQPPPRPLAVGALERAGEACGSCRAAQPPARSEGARWPASWSGLRAGGGSAAAQGMAAVLWGGPARGASRLDGLARFGVTVLPAREEH